MGGRSQGRKNDTNIITGERQNKRFKNETFPRQTEKAFEKRVFHMCTLALACQNQAYLKKHDFQKHNFWLHNKS